MITREGEGAANSVFDVPIIFLGKDDDDYSLKGIVQWIIKGFDIILYVDCSSGWDHYILNEKEYNKSEKIQLIEYVEEKVLSGSPVCIMLDNVYDSDKPLSSIADNIDTVLRLSNFSTIRRGDIRVFGVIALDKFGSSIIKSIMHKS